MTLDAIREAKSKARRFLVLAEDAEKRIAEDHCILFTGSKETAAMKRASMDLTRALVKVR